MVNYSKSQSSLSMVYCVPPNSFLDLMNLPKLLGVDITSNNMIEHVKLLYENVNNNFLGNYLNYKERVDKKGGKIFLKLVYLLWYI